MNKVSSENFIQFLENRPRETSSLVVGGFLSAATFATMLVLGTSASILIPSTLLTGLVTGGGLYLLLGLDGEKKNA